MLGTSFHEAESMSVYFVPVSRENILLYSRWSDSDLHYCCMQSDHCHSRGYNQELSALRIKIINAQVCIQ